MVARVDEHADVSPRVFDGSLLSLLHPVLDLGESLFDGIKVQRIGRHLAMSSIAGADERYRREPDQEQTVFFFEPKTFAPDKLPNRFM